MRTRRRVALYLDIRSNYDQGIARGVIRYAKEHGTWHLFGHGWMLSEIQNPSGWNGDGIISRIKNTEEAQALSAIAVPVVDVAGTLSLPNGSSVTNDDFSTGRIVGEHLLSCVFPRFGFCGASGSRWSDERLDGFLAALNLKRADVACFEKPLEWWWEKLARDRSLQRWLKSLRTPLGIMACNDAAGVKLTGACQALGIAVPRQIGVVGVDNEEVLCELSAPSLSSVPCDCEKIGYEAGAMLDRMMQKRIKNVTPVRVPPKPLVVRASSDTLAIDDEAVAIALRFIRGNTDLSINVSDVLRAVPLCRRSLEMRFRRALGHTILDEIRRTRLEHACRLLQNTDLPAAKVALAAGFSSHRRFHTVFVEAMKMKPPEYRILSRQCHLAP